MAASFPPNQKLFFFNLLTLIAMFCSSAHSGYAEEGSGATLAKAFFCFNNKFIYSGCNEAYRLSESGNLGVPIEATDLFCNGPCLAETQLVLNCVDKVLSDFMFYNKATVRDVRNTLYAGCSFTSRRGKFDVRDYMQGGLYYAQGGFSNAYRLLHSMNFCAFSLFIGVVFLII